MKTWTFIFTNKGFFPLFLLIKKTTAYFQHRYNQRLFLGARFLHNRFAELCWNACHYTVWESRFGGWVGLGVVFFLVWVVLRKVTYDQAQNFKCTWLFYDLTEYELRCTHSVPLCTLVGVCLMFNVKLESSIRVLTAMCLHKQGLYWDQKLQYSLLLSRVLLASVNRPGTEHFQPVVMSKHWISSCFWQECFRIWVVSLFRPNLTDVSLALELVSLKLFLWLVHDLVNWKWSALAAI